MGKPRTRTIVTTVAKVGAHGSLAETKSIDGVPFKGDDSSMWGIPAELGAELHDDVVITMDLNMTRFISYKHAGTGKRVKA